MQIRSLYPDQRLLEAFRYTMSGACWANTKYGHWYCFIIYKESKRIYREKILQDIATQSRLIATSIHEIEFNHDNDGIFLAITEFEFSHSL